MLYYSLSDWLLLDDVVLITSSTDAGIMAKFLDKSDKKKNKSMKSTTQQTEDVLSVKPARSAKFPRLCVTITRFWSFDWTAVAAAALIQRPPAVTMC